MGFFTLPEISMVCTQTRHSCWCFWSLDVPVAMLANAKVIEACAMDESMNMQPRDMLVIDSPLRRLH